MVPMVLQRLIEHVPESMVVTDPKGNILIVNPAFTKVTGYLPEEVIGQNPRILKSGRQNELFYKNMWSHLLTHNTWQGEIWNKRKNGEIYPEWLSISAARDQTGEISHFMGIFTDITLRKISENTLHYQATHDPLTGLPNRTLFVDRLHQAIALNERSQNLVAIMFLDLDNFKPVNDRLGHSAGDQLLTAVAERTLGCIRHGDTLARIGGDEFGVLLMNVANTPSVAKIAQNILDVLSKPYNVAHHHFCNISASIGISLFPFDGGKAENLIRSADLSMYQAKKNGRNQYVFSRDFSSSPTDTTTDSAGTSSTLHTIPKA